MKNDLISKPLIMLQEFKSTFYASNVSTKKINILDAIKVLFYFCQICNPVEINKNS